MKDAADKVGKWDRLWMGRHDSYSWWWHHQKSVLLRPTGARSSDWWRPLSAGRDRMET